MSLVASYREPHLPSSMTYTNWVCEDGRGPSSPYMLFALVQWVGCVLRVLENSAGYKGLERSREFCVVAIVVEVN